MSWLDAFFGGVAIVQFAGVPQPTERAINFLNATGGDDPSNGRTNVTINATVAPGAAGTALFTNAAGNATTWVAISGDAASNAAVPGQVTVQGILTKAIPALPGSTSALVYNGTAFVWTATTALGALTAFGADLVNSTATAQYVSAISYSSSLSGGTVAINGINTTFQVAANNAGFTISQAGLGPASGTATSITIAPQGANASNGTPGSLIVNVGAFTGTGAPGGIIVQQAGVFQAQLGAYVSAGYSALWLAPALAPSNINYTLANNGTNNVVLNGPAAASSIVLALAGVGQATITSSPQGMLAPSNDLGIWLGSNAQRWGRVAAGPVGYLVYHAVNDANPSAELADGYVSLGVGGATAMDGRLIRIGAHNWQFDDTAGGPFTLNIGGTSSTGSSVQIPTQVNSGPAPANLTIQPQWQFGTDQGTAAKNTPGFLVINWGAPYTTTNAGSEVGVTFQRAGVTLGYISSYGGSPNYLAVYGPGGISSTAFAFIAGTSSTIFNSPSGGAIYFRVGNSPGCIYTGSTLSFTPESAAGANAGTNALYWNYVTSAQYTFPNTVSGVINFQNTPLSDVAAGSLTINSQGAWPSASTNKNAGSLILDAGAPVAGGAAQVLVGNTNTTKILTRVNATTVMSLGQAGTDFLKLGAVNSAMAMTPTGITWDVNVLSPTIQQTALSANANPSNITILTQGPANATGATIANNTPGSFIVSFPNAGSVNAQGLHATFQIVDNASVAFYMGLNASVSLGVTSAANIWMQPGVAPTVGNYSIQAGGGTTYINGPTSNIQFGVANTMYAQLTTVGFYPVNAGGSQLGATGLPWSNLFTYDMASAGAAHGGYIGWVNPLSGTNNTQVNKIVTQVYNVRTTSTTATTIATIAVPASQQVSVFIRCAGRFAAATFFPEYLGYVATVSNNGGTLTGLAWTSLWTQPTSLGTLTITSSGTNLLVQVNAAEGTTTMDWVAIIEIMYN